MRIGFLVGRFPSVSETFILSQITGLIDRGHQVDIFAGSGDTSIVHADVRARRLLETTLYRPSIPTGRMWIIGKTVVLAARYGWKAPSVLARVARVRRGGRSRAAILAAAVPFLGKRRYDVIHCHFGPNGILGDTLREVGAFDAPLITTFHGYDASKYVQAKGRDVYARLFRHGDRFLAISDRMKRQLIELGCEERKATIHRVGIDLGTLRPAPRPLGRNARILSVARLIEKKGLEYGLRAVGRLVREGLPVSYEIVGDGPLRPRLQALIAELGLQSSVHLLGAMPKEGVLEEIMRAHILLAPSVTAADGDQEGVPVALMEAMATGLPVVSTLHSGIPELVQDGVSGYLVPERDVEALADRVGFLVTHPELQPDMGRAGRRQVEALHDIQMQNDRLVDLYRELGHSWASARRGGRSG